MPLSPIGAGGYHPGMPDPVPPDRSAALVDFVLRHVRVKTNVCSRQRGRRGYTLNPRLIPDYNFIYPIRGRIVWVIGDEPIELSPGMMVIVPPNVTHGGFSRTKVFDFGSVHVEATLAGGRDVFELLGPPRVQRINRRGRLWGYLLGAAAEFDRPREQQAMLMLPSWGPLIVLELILNNAEQELLRPRPINAVVAELLEELHRRVNQPTSLQQLSQWSGFSAHHLNRQFHRELGTTPLRYLMRLRLERAAALLSDGRLTVAAVAGQFGFDDPKYFSRAFRRHFGLSPADYRQRAGPESPP